MADALTRLGISVPADGDYDWGDIIGGVNSVNTALQTISSRGMWTGVDNPGTYSISGLLTFTGSGGVSGNLAVSGGGTFGSNIVGGVNSNFYNAKGTISSVVLGTSYDLITGVTSGNRCYKVILWQENSPGSIFRESDVIIDSGGAPVEVNVKSNSIGETIVLSLGGSANITYTQTVAGAGVNINYTVMKLY